MRDRQSARAATTRSCAQARYQKNFPEQRMADAIFAGSRIMNERLHVAAGPAGFKADIDCSQYSSGMSVVSR
jgi:hypothetical protein